MLTPELMARVKRLQLRSKRAVNEVFAGEYVSAFKGRGMEFSEVRAYQPGDDVRLIDWNVTARAGEPFVKRFIEERELTLLLVVDVSGSTTFGSVEREKRETAAELGALLTMVALRANDKVGLVSFDDEVRTFVPARKGQNHGLRVMRELLAPGALDEGGGRRERLRRLFGGAGRERRETRPVVALEHVARTMKKRAIVVMISDFLFPPLVGANGESDGALGGGALESTLKLVRRRHDLILARVSDPRESELPAVGLIDLVDLETGVRRTFDSSSRGVRRRLRSRAEMHRRRVELLAERVGADLLQVETGRSYVDDLHELFHRRERRRAR